MCRILVHTVSSITVCMCVEFNEYMYKINLECIYNVLYIHYIHVHVTHAYHIILQCIIIHTLHSLLVIIFLFAKYM